MTIAEFARLQDVSLTTLERRFADGDFLFCSRNVRGQIHLQSEAAAQIMGQAPVAPDAPSPLDKRPVGRPRTKPLPETMHLTDAEADEFDRNSRRFARTGSVGDEGGGDKPPVGYDADDVPYNVSRAKREKHQAAIAELRLAQMAGELVDREVVKQQAFESARRVRDALLNIPDRIATQLAAMKDAHEVHQALLSEINDVLKGLTEDVSRV